MKITLNNKATLNKKLFLFFLHIAKNKFGGSFNVKQILVY